jgi:hypothetical protein
LATDDLNHEPAGKAAGDKRGNKADDSRQEFQLGGSFALEDIQEIEERLA